MIELTEQQHQELQKDTGPPRVLDPVTSTEYVLLRADLFARLQLLAEQAADEAEQDRWANLVEEARSEMANE